MQVVLRPESWSKPLPLPLRRNPRGSFIGLGLAIGRAFVGVEEDSDSGDEDVSELLGGGADEGDAAVKMDDVASEGGLSSVPITMLTWFKSFVGSAVSAVVLTLESVLTRRAGAADAERVSQRRGARCWAGNSRVGAALNLLHVSTGHCEEDVDPMHHCQASTYLRCLICFTSMFSSGCC